MKEKTTKCTVFQSDSNITRDANATQYYFLKASLNSSQDPTLRARNTYTSQGQSQEILFQEGKPKTFNEKAY